MSSKEAKHSPHLDYASEQVITNCDIITIYSIVTISVSMTNAITILHSSCQHQHLHHAITTIINHHCHHPHTGIFITTITIITITMVIFELALSSQSSRLLPSPSVSHISITVVTVVTISTTANMTAVPIIPAVVSLVHIIPTIIPIIHHNCCHLYFHIAIIDRETAEMLRHTPPAPPQRDGKR